MKNKHVLIFICLIIGQAIFAQGHWRTLGNPAAGIDGVAGGNNIFGTLPNFPIRIITNNTLRMKLNHTLNYAVGTYPLAQRNGYLLLGYTGTYSAPIFDIANGGAFSLLHLNGPLGTFVQQGGYRGTGKYRE